MTQPEPSRRRRRGVLGVLLSLTVVTLGAGVFSLAIFTDSAASSGSFATGTIDITSNPAVAFTVGNMMPGDTNTQALTIANAGTATLRYAMVSAATNVLGSTLLLEVKDPRYQLRDVRRHDRRRPDHPQRSAHRRCRAGLPGGRSHPDRGHQ